MLSIVEVLIVASVIAVVDDDSASLIVVAVNCEIVLVVSVGRLVKLVSISDVSAVACELVTMGVVVDDSKRKIILCCFKSSEIKIHRNH